jgi:hypothetical protein
VLFSAPFFVYAGLEAWGACIFVSMGYEGRFKALWGVLIGLVVW